MFDFGQLSLRVRSTCERGTQYYIAVDGRDDMRSDLLDGDDDLMRNRDSEPILTDCGAHYHEGGYCLPTRQR